LVRSPRLGLGVVLALVFATIGISLACGGEEDNKDNPTPGDGGLDGLLVGDITPPIPPNNEPPPGDVCGNKAGLFNASPWPLRGGCPTRAGWSGTGGPQTSSTFWTTPIPASETSVALEAAGGGAWFGTETGDIVSVQTGTGTIRSVLPTGNTPIRSSPAMDIEGSAILVGADGVLYGLRPGQLAQSDAGPDAGPRPPIAFSIAVGASASSPVIGSDGTIYVGTLAGELVAVAAHGLSKKWSARTNDTSGSSPAIAQDGTIWVGSSDHKLYGINPADGAITRTVDLGAEVKGSSPVVGGDNTIYIATADGKLHAITKEGTEKWPAYATGGAITTSSPAVYAGAVYIGSEDKKLHAVNTKDGTKRWTYDTLGTVGTPVIGPDGTVYVGATDSRLYAITSKGSLFFAVNVRGRVKGAPPALSPGPTLYVTTDKGVLAIGP
jgi:outer membrane protein assembly factor BamB